jgi:hypothetical protein
MRLRECWPRSIDDMPEHRQTIQTTGPTRSTVPEILLADLLGHPALAQLQPDERTALRLAAEELERLAAAGIALRLRIAHVGDVVPISLVDARASVYGTIDAPRELHIWVNGDDVIGKSGLTAPVLLQVLAAAAGLPPAGEPWAAVALPPVVTLNAVPGALADSVQLDVIQRSAGEMINT